MIFDDTFFMKTEEDGSHEDSLLDLYAMITGIRSHSNQHERWFTIQLVRKSDTPACKAGFNDLHHRFMRSSGGQINLSASYLFCKWYASKDHDGFASSNLIIRNKCVLNEEHETKYEGRFATDIFMTKFEVQFDVEKKD